MIIVGLLDLPDGSDGKESACSAGDPGSIPGSGRFSVWRREWQPTPVFLPREFHGQRSLASYSPQGHEEDMDTTEQLTHTLWDFPGGPVVKNPPCNAGDMGLIPSQGTKIPHTAVSQLLSQHASTKGPA